MLGEQSARIGVIACLHSRTHGRRLNIRLICGCCSTLIPSNHCLQVHLDGVTFHFDFSSSLSDKADLRRLRLDRQT